MDHRSVVKAYGRLANQYDRFFGPVFEHGRQQALARMACGAGDRVLEVGVGTGISIPQYPEGVEVTGIDVSEEMLEKARDKLNGDSERVRLEVMDAQALTYADNSFDKVVAMYVVSVAPDPAAVVEQMKRVCRPGGDLFIVNHFTRDKGVMAALERMVSPLARTVGFRPMFPLSDFLESADLDGVSVEPVNLFGYWSLLHTTNDKAL